MTVLFASQVRYSVEAGLLLLGLCVLLGPVIAERARVPGLLGLVGAGTLLGPHGLEWVNTNGLIAMLGAVGLLYLMFVAGLELDIRAFLANRKAALTFGAATFLVPFGLSFVVGRLYLGLGVSATALIGAMWASHTVVAYPEVKAAGVDRTRPVGLSLSATVITDLAALVILALAASSSALSTAPEIQRLLEANDVEPIDTTHVLPLWAGLVLMMLVCFGVVPRITRWLFAHILFRRTERFVWALVVMAIGAVTGLLGGIEGLVGAFLAGIGMNTAVPTRTELMERIEFIGSALLVPAFLVTVGLSVDPRALFDVSTLGLAAIFTATVVVGKAAAAAITGRAFGYTTTEIALMASLTIGQAAATLAVAQIGVQTGLFDNRIRNAAVVTVLVSVVIASVGTRLAARRLRPPEDDRQLLGDHVLVLAPPDGSIGTRFANIASSLVARDGGLITPAAIRANRTSGLSDIELRLTRDKLRVMNQTLVRLGHDTHPIHRVADDIAAGVGNLADEIQASLVVVPFDDESTHSPTDFASEMVRLANASAVPVAAITAGVMRTRRVVLLASGAERRQENLRDMALAARIAGETAGGRGDTIWLWPPQDESTLELPDCRIEQLGDHPGYALPRPAVQSGDLVVAPLGAIDIAAELEIALTEDVTVVVVTMPKERGSRSLHWPERPFMGTIVPATT